MATEVNLPALGESVTEGTVARWLAGSGRLGGRRQAAARGLHRQGRHRDPLPVAGTLLEIKAQEDGGRVGAVLALIGDEAESADSGAPTPPPRGAARRRGQAEKAEQEQGDRGGSRPRNRLPPRPPAAERPTNAAETKPSGGSGGGHPAGTR